MMTQNTLVSVLVLPILWLASPANALESDPPPPVAATAPELPPGLKEIRQGLSQRGMQVGLDVAALALSELRRREATDTPWGSCQILTSPRLPRQFGLTPERGNGWVDTVMQSWLQSVAAVGRPVDGIGNVQAIRDYRRCLALYGTTIAQAMVNLITEIDALSPGDRGGLAYQDVRRLADVAIDAAIRTGPTDAYLLDLLTAIRDDTSPCTFGGNLEKIRCGGSEIVLTAAPALTHGGIPVFGRGWAGMQGSVTATSSGSYAQALEQLQLVVGEADQAKQAETQATLREAAGDGAGAYQIRRQAVERAITQGSEDQG